jgi:arsenate reductase (thioredoxin)
MKQEQTIVFVCEHGSAKSVVAAAHFNRLAGERGSGLRAVSRGTDPDAEIAPNAEAGLRADGLGAVDRSPAKLTQADAAGAVRVVTFCELPEAYTTAERVEHWDDVPPVSEDYAKARDEIVGRIRRLLDGLGAAN